MTDLRLMLPCLLLAAFLAGCSPRAAATDFVRTPSYAISQSEPTTLGKAFAAEAAANPGTSGFRLVATGTNAFRTRIALVRAAEKTLDLQYYSVHDDLTGQILLEEMLRAADRGVRIRILIDDLNIKKVADVVTVLNLHPGIEVRAFNAFSTRNQPIWSRIGNYFTDLGRMTKRMHNKTLIADNQAAIVGGRNLGDEYFDASSDFGFSDMDVLSIGPVTARISHSFDRYWNSDESFPLEALHVTVPDEQQVAEVRTRLYANWQQATGLESGQVLRTLDPIAQMRPLVWAPADVSVDPPQKVQQDSEDNESKPILRLDRLLDRAESEFVVITPYFVPKEEGVRWFRDLTGRGIRVRILTNSLASLDVAAVYAGYRRYRRPLLEAGVELYEFKPIPGKRTRQTLKGSSSRASLHAKVYVIDRKDVFISSFNLDPRSVELNTELAVIIHSPELARQILDMFAESTAPESSYRVRLMPEEGGGDASLVWETVEDGRPVTRTREPPAGIWRRFTARLFALLPLEDQL